MRADQPASGTGRLAGVDAARAVALVGMFATHILPLRADGAPTPVGLVADGRSSALFAVLAGVGVALSTGGPRRPADARAHRAAAAALAVRGLLVGLLGLWLVEFDPPVAVILAYYGLLFVVATPLLRLPATALAVGAVVACVLGPAMSLLLRSGLPAGPGGQPGLAAVAQPGALLETLALTGVYPVLPWITYLLAGMAVGRMDLRSARVAAGLLAVGTVLALLASGASALLLGPGGGAAALGPTALAQRRYGTTPTGSWWWLAVDTPHSGAPLDLAHTTGTALAVLGAMLLLARWARPAVLVPAALGAVPLTLYTLHVVALAAYPGTVPDGSPDEGALLVGHVLAATAIATALWLAGRRGPLESVVSGAARRVRVALNPAPPAPAPGR
ncbi:heparan-alpha-glucosaminide N-acetyltransferase domain-containing protein [Pseudonocardia sp. CA-142604]|uniref:heparan-alpha-glucosaminide N-acetyltransferase domain-containing protein n=1 Tax=Pseudonocardia sp. CA-142604 TaxID=3240024 RepID=UPI003D94897D